MKDKQSRFVINHNKYTNILTLTCTKELVARMHEIFNNVCPIEYASRETTIEDTWNEDGKLFPSCAVIKFTVQYDVVEVFFEAAKTMLRQSISESINHNQN